MRPQLIIDLGGRALSALLVTADGELVPCSQEIRGVATRHASNDILLDPRVVEDRDFSWEDALEGLANTDARGFFQRARRIGLRRPWDPHASAEALQLSSPLTVLSAPNALADRAVEGLLPRAALTMLDALLEPAFAFVLGSQLVPGEIDPIVILPGQTGRLARVVLEKLFRRRGFRSPFVVRRELAAAMARADNAPCECAVIETSETDLHLHRVAVDGNADERRVRTVASVTLAGLGWDHWSARIAEALGLTPGAAFERALTALLTGSPDSLAARLTHAALARELDGIDSHDLSKRLRKPLATLDAEGLPLFFAGEIFAIDAVREVFRAGTLPPPDLLRNVASAMRARVLLAPGGTLRVNTLRGDAIELVSETQLPAPGEGCRVETDFIFGGDRGAGQPILLHLLWGADSAPEGNATLCTMPVKPRGGGGLRLTVHLRRSAAGRRLHGTVEARMPGDAVVARARFTQELEVMR
jgi:hypothetical protein